jgi:hypothetical protein
LAVLPRLEAQQAPEQPEPADAAEWRLPLAERVAAEWLQAVLVLQPPQAVWMLRPMQVSQTSARERPQQA